MPHGRIGILQKKLQKLTIDAFLVRNPLDILYFTGMRLSKGMLFVSSQKAVLFIDGRYFETASEKLDCEVVLWGEKALSDFLGREELSSIKRIGIDAGKTTLACFSDLKKEIKRGAIKRQCIPVRQPIDSIRAIKDTKEISKIKASCRLCVDGFLSIQKHIYEGVTEKELATHVEIFWREKGAESSAFPPIIAFSENSSMPHYQSGNRKLKKGDIILVDIGVVLDGYCSDMTRMLSFGVKNKKLLDMFSVVKCAQEAALAACVPGRTFTELDEVARTVIQEHGYGDYFVHSLGHGLGLEIHEWPILKQETNRQLARKQVLEENMCITIEPGIYIPQIGGIRIEDTVRITKNGPEILTKCSKELINVKAQ